MTRVTASDLELPFSLSTTTYPTLAQTNTMITNLYRQASDILEEDYSATVPDNAILYSLIAIKMINWIMRVDRIRKSTTNNQELPILIFSKEEIDIITNRQNDDFYGYGVQG